MEKCHPSRGRAGFWSRLAGQLIRPPNYRRATAFPDSLWKAVPANSGFYLRLLLFLKRCKEISLSLKLRGLLSAKQNKIKSSHHWFVSRYYRYVWNWQLSSEIPKPHHAWLEQAIVFVISMGSPFNILFRPLGNCSIIDERKPKRDRKLENKWNYGERKAGG